MHCYSIPTPADSLIDRQHTVVADLNIGQWDHGNGIYVDMMIASMSTHNVIMLNYNHSACAAAAHLPSFNIDADSRGCSPLAVSFPI